MATRRSAAGRTARDTAGGTPRAQGGGGGAAGPCAWHAPMKASTKPGHEASSAAQRRSEAASVSRPRGECTTPSPSGSASALRPAPICPRSRAPGARKQDADVIAHHPSVGSLVTVFRAPDALLRVCCDGECGDGVREPHPPPGAARGAAGPGARSTGRRSTCRQLGFREHGVPRCSRAAASCFAAAARADVARAAHEFAPRAAAPATRRILARDGAPFARRSLPCSEPRSRAPLIASRRRMFSRT